MLRDEKDGKSLLEIAESVSKLVIDSAKMKRFRKQDRAFYEAYKVRGKKYDVYCEIILQHRKAAETNPRLREYADGKPPHKGWIWEDNFLPYNWKGFWRPAIKEPSPDLLDLLSLYDISSMTNFIVPSTPPPKFTDAEKLMMDYVLLTIIHDKALKSPPTPKISDGIWPEGKEGGWDNDAWREIEENFDKPGKQTHINLAFDRVEADIANLKPAETKRNAVPAKCWGIKRIFKKTSHFILTIIGAIFVTVIAAIAVDIFADFGWLQSIKAFIYGILWPK